MKVDLYCYNGFKDTLTYSLKMALPTVILFLSLLNIITAAPNCTYHGTRKTHLICSSTDGADYILKRGLVSDSNKTTSITLRGCRITEIKKESFQNLFYLESLDLSDNSISQLKLGVLDGNRNLKKLNLSMNFISGLPLGLFDQKPQLLELDMSSNRLDELKRGIFDAFKKLKYLDLSNNSLQAKQLNPYIFDGSRVIKYIDFSKNDMNEGPENLLHAFQSLETLNLKECFLTEVPLFAIRKNLKTLKTLSMSKNQISALTNITTFVNLENLEKLDITENLIEDIKEEVFAPLRKLKVISLRGNRLTNLPDKLFQNMPLLGNIDLSYNKITMVPVNTFRGTALKNLNVSNNRFTYLTDNFCLELRNSGVKLAKFYFNQNPWQCSCLQDILREVKKFNVEYNSAFYNGRKPVCTTTEEYICKRQQEFNDLYTQMYDDTVKNK